MNLRLLILETLLAIEKDDQPAGFVIKQVMDKYEYLDRHERSFLKRVLEGVTERRIELDYITDSYSKTPVSRMKPVIRAIMRMSVYQLKYMDSIPDAAVCNEAVKLAAKKGFGSLKGFVNGVLRNIARHIGDITYPDENTAEGISVRYSCPQWLVEQLIEEQGAETASSMLRASLETSDIFVRVNRSKITVEELMIKLKDEGISCERMPYHEGALRLENIDSIKRISSFGEGLFQVQDVGSMLVTELAEIQKGDTVFDVCAAPGGKSMHALDILGGSGHVYSFDITDHKLELIKENAARLGYDNIDIINADASCFDPAYEGKADVLIADLPCSGLGVLGRKNDIKYNMTPEKEASLTKLQREILKNVSRYLKSGGTLVFSTCTVHAEENTGNFRFICDELPFEPVSFYDKLPDVLKCETAREGYIQLIPGIHDCDGFFISKFVKNTH